MPAALGALGTVVVGGEIVNPGTLPPLNVNDDVDGAADGARVALMIRAVFAASV